MSQTAPPPAPGTGEIMEMLRSRIRLGLLVPGQRLVEADLVELTGASRAKLREALRGLAFEGIVELQEFKGAIVKRFSKADLLQMWQLREAVEGFAAKLCTQNASASTVKTLLRLQQDMEAAAVLPSIKAFFEANDAWHLLIGKAANNKYLSRTFDGLRVTVHRLESRLDFSAKGMSQAAQEHRAVTDAIAAKDPAAAEAAMRRHIASNYARTERLPEHYFH